MKSITKILSFEGLTLISLDKNTIMEPINNNRKIRRGIMLTISKWLLIIAGALLIFDSILIFAGIPNPLSPDLPLPCPVTLILLGAEIFLFAIGSKSFKSQ